MSDDTFTLVVQAEKKLFDVLALIDHAMFCDGAQRDVDIAQARRELQKAINDVINLKETLKGGRS
jgi:hypothetical protein